MSTRLPVSRALDCMTIASGCVNAKRRLQVPQPQNEKPRHVAREAGLVITFDLCPVTPGSCTRLSTSLQIRMCVRLGQSVIRLLELDYPSRAPALQRGLR